MALIREAVEDCAPPGSVTRQGDLTAECSASLNSVEASPQRFTEHAEALVRGIYAIAGRSRRA